MDDDRQQRIKDRAHHLWEQSGRPDGLHDEHWGQAEREIGGSSTRQAGTPTAGDAAVVATEKRKPKKV